MLISQNIALGILTGMILAFEPTAAQVKLLHRPMEDVSNLLQDSLKQVSQFTPVDSRFNDIFQIVRSYYPELNDAAIELKFRKHAARLISARPNLNFFTSKRKRAYSIVVVAGSEDFILEKDINAQVGLIAHEFSHLVDYSAKNNIALAGWIVRYGLSKKFQEKVERATDMDVIRHGLGWQLRRYSLYLKDSEIEQMMKDAGY